MLLNPGRRKRTVRRCERRGDVGEQPTPTCLPRGLLVLGSQIGERWNDGAMKLVRTLRGVATCGPPLPCAGMRLKAGNGARGKTNIATGGCTGVRRRTRAATAQYGHRPNALEELILLRSRGLQLRRNNGRIAAWTSNSTTLIWSTRARARVRVCVRACACAPVCAWVRACACVLACVRACVGARGCVCVCGCVRSCVRACVRTCVRAGAGARACA